MDGINELIATKGKKVIKFDLRKESPGEEEILAVMIGPSGKLRAPTLRVGKRLIVGFDEETYQKVFG